MHFVLVPFGSSGDVYPYMGVGVGLKSLGHRVTVVTHSRFGGLVRRIGLEHFDLDDEADYDRTLNHPDHWHPRKGLTIGARFILATMPKHYAAMERLYVPGRTVVVTAHCGYGVRVAQDKLGFPLVSAHVSPTMIRSVARPFVQPVGDAVLNLLIFRGGRDLFFWVADKAFIDPLMAREINRFRAAVGLPPVSRVAHRWIHSPQLILGLFPRWMVEPVPTDWPDVVCTGFSFFDDANGALPADVTDFLTAGEPPVVFTTGSGTAARPFYDAAVHACRLLNRRGLLLTRSRDQVPADLPDGVRHYPFLPLSQVLPHAAALVSHGGIGTAAQAVRAGVPQLMMPACYDQPETAWRLTKLGVARTLRPGQFRGPRVAHQLRHLLACPDVRRRCRELADRIPATDPVAETCARLEAFARSVAGPPVDSGNPPLLTRVGA